MGYVSDIRVMTNLEGFEKMQDRIWDFVDEKDKKGEPLNHRQVLFPIPGKDPQKFFDFYDAQEDYLCFGFNSIRWYDGTVEVDLFEEMLDSLVDEVPWQFIRVGEDLGDVQNSTSNTFLDPEYTMPIMYTQTAVKY